MRIAYVCTDPGVPVFGRKGCSIHVQEVLRALRRRGATVILFAVRTGGDPPADLRGLPVHELPAVTGAPAEREHAAMRANGVLRDALESRGRFDLVYERHALWSCAAMEYARDAGVRGMLEVNAPLVEEQSRYRTLVHALTARHVADRAFAAADVLVAVSEEVAAYLRRQASARGRVAVVPNGVDVARFSGDAAERTADEPFTVGFVGTLKAWHGVESLVRVFARLRREVDDARLLLVGDGPERPSIEAALVAAGVAEAATLTGSVDPADVPALIDRMSVAAAPYPNLRDFYFSPLKVYEYMAAGSAIVASDIGQIRHLLSHERTALLHAPGDEDALLAALGRLAGNPGLRRRLGRTARDEAVREHTWDAVVELLRLAAPVSQAG